MGDAATSAGNGELIETLWNVNVSLRRLIAEQNPN